MPGAGEIIISEFQKQGSHRRSLETRESRAASFSTRTITLTVSALPFATMVVGAYLAVAVEWWIGVPIIISPMIAIMRSKKGG